MRARRAGLIVILVPIIGVGVLLAIRNREPDARAEALAFLSAYRAVSRKPFLGGPGGDSISFERQAYLREEDARMIAMLPRSHGWRFSRTTGMFPYEVTATAAALSPSDRMILRVPFLSRFFRVTPAIATIRLIGFKRTFTESEARAVYGSGVGWTRAQADLIGRDWGIDAPPEPAAHLELTPSPSAPGRKIGE